MTPRGVVSDLMRGRPAERMGYFENVWGDTLRQWVQDEGYPADADGRPVSPATHFDMDLWMTGGLPDWQPLRGVNEVVEESESWIVRRNGAGAALKHWKEKSGTPEHIDFRMQNRAIWERDYRPHLVDLTPERFDAEACRTGIEAHHAAGKAAFFGHMFVWEIMRKSLGDICLYESLALDPDWIHDFCRVYTDFYIVHLQALIEEAGPPDGARLCEDLGFKERLFCSPSMLAELVFPYYREIVDFYHSHDVPVLLHSCGYVEEALPLIEEAGFDGLDPMERRAGCDPQVFIEKTGSRILLRGGFDKTILESGDRAAMKQSLLELLAMMKVNGVRYMFSTDHSVSTNVTYADYRYVVDVFRDNCGYG